MVGNFLKKVPLLSALFIICGCATLYNPATERNEVILINTATEGAIGENINRQFASQHSVWREEAAASRVRSVGARLAAVCERKDIEYKFFVLSDSTLNALALPGGFIYINKGLLDLVNDDELAYVLGHEVGHVAAKHMVKKLQGNMAYQLILSAAFASAADKLGPNAGDIAQGIDTAYGLVVDLPFSRKDEYEADRLAVKYAYNAGFDPYGSLSALELIGQTEGPNWRVMGYFRTHPFAEDRARALKAYIPWMQEEKKPK